MSKNLKSSVVTITGGTGSFGSTMVKDLIKQDVAEIRIFSRDENKQDSMRNSIKDERLRFFISFFNKIFANFFSFSVFPFISGESIPLSLTENL